MRFFRRSLIALGVAAMLPTIVFAAVSVFYLLRLDRERIQSAAIRNAASISAIADARLQRDLAVLSVLGNSTSLDEPNWLSFYRRAARIVAGNGWAELLVIDGATRRVLYRLPGEFERVDAPLEPRHRDAVAVVLNSNEISVGEVERADEPTIWVYAPTPHSKQHLVLAVALHTAPFQRTLMTHTAEGTTTAMLDRAGNFIARSVNYEERVGTPATAAERNTVRQASQGIYQGETFEGVKNYTAYHTSLLSGWSTHVSMASRLIDQSTMWSFAVAGLAGLGALLLGGVLIVLVLRDMAERRQAEDALRQSQKMEAVGQLTGGIAHDFNNLLTAVIGNLDMIQNRAGNNERLRRLATNALEAARRGSKLAAQLLAFSRTQRMTVRRIDLRALLDGMSGLLTQSVGPSVRVDIDIDPQARHVVSDANQLELALLNLAVNARDAMGGVGTLQIRSRPSLGAHRGLPPGDYVDVLVTDTGVGMPEHVLHKAVEPFFTTKPIGQGTGLGLSQVYGVVHESGGALAIDSAPGKGTTIRLTLPRATAADPLTSPIPVAVAESHAESEAPVAQILVVDDDRLVRRFMADSLRNLGYAVVDVAEGASALEALRAQRFDLLIVDFAMPNMNGAEVAQRARELHRDLKILVVSGYADSAALESAVGSAAQLRKPFDVAELRAAVTAVLSNSL
jgi:signal transduction histidine kinase